MKLVLIIAAVIITSSCGDQDHDYIGKCRIKGDNQVLFRTPDQLPSENPNIGWVHVTEDCHVDTFYYDNKTYDTTMMSYESISEYWTTLRFKDGTETKIEIFEPYDPKQDR